MAKNQYSKRGSSQIEMDYLTPKHESYTTKRRNSDTMLSNSKQFLAPTNNISPRSILKNRKSINETSNSSINIMNSANLLNKNLETHFGFKKYNLANSKVKSSKSSYFFRKNRKSLSTSIQKQFCFNNSNLGKRHSISVFK